MTIGTKVTLLVGAAVFVGGLAGYTARTALIVPAKPCPIPTITGTIFPMPSPHDTEADVPTEVFIKGERWKIKETVWRDSTVGQTQCQLRVIYYENQPNKAALRETLWHEVIHAANCKFEDDALAHWKGFTMGSPTHDTVYKMGAFLAEFGMTNPEFLQWASQND